MTSTHNTGLTDFTSSEWSLELMSRICGLLYRNRAVGSTQIVSIIKGHTHLTNRAVIARYIRLMSKLGILAPPEEDYILTGEGKALVALARNTENEQLTPYEKTFFYLRLFTTAQMQLLTLLATLEAPHTDNKSQVATEYFKRLYSLPYQIWPRPTIKRALEVNERTGRLVISLQTKFDCMAKWLQQISLIRGFSLTQVGHNLLSYFTLHPIDPQVVCDAAVAYIENNPDFFGSAFIHTEVSKNQLTALFMEAYKLFETKELHLSDARAIWHYMWVKAIWEYHLVLNDTDFRSLLDEFLEKKIIRSVSAGRDGKIAQISEA